jgi:integrase
MRKSKNGYPRGVFEREAGSGVYWIRYQDADGRERKEQAGSFRAAEDLVGKRRQQAREGVKLPENLRSRAVTFGDIAKAALEYKASKPSYSVDKCRMKKLVTQFGNRKAESIKPEDIENWLASETYAQSTKNRFLCLMKLAFSLAEKNGKIKVNAARLVKQTKENNERVRYLNEHKPLPTKQTYLKPHATEEGRLRAVIAKRYPSHVLEIDVALNTGMRKSEQYGLEWTSVNFERRLLTIPRSKNDEKRHIQLNAAAISALKALLPGMERSNLVFKGLQDSRHWFGKAVAEAGIRDFHWHDLRHTFASRLVMAGVPLLVVKELMGHRSIKVTERYAHLAPGFLQTGVEKLDGYNNFTGEFNGTTIAPKSAVPRKLLRARSSNG